MAWTDEQNNAIKTTGRDLLVSAAAGSGKTAVLSERVIHRILNCDDIDIDDFLIVTFTNGAASEMRERIGKKLIVAYENDNTNKHLARQITLMNRANITTIHSFCLDVIRNNIHFLDIDPNFKIAETAQVTIMQLQCADETLEMCYDTESTRFSKEHSSQFSNLCQWIGNGKDEKLIDVILSIYNSIQSMPDPLLYLKEQIERYNIDETDDNIWINSLMADYKSRLQDILTNWVIIATNAKDEGLLKYYQKMMDDVGLIESLLLSTTASWEELYNVACAFKFSDMRGVKSKEDPDITHFYKENIDKMKAEINGKKGIINQILSFPPNEIIPRLNGIYPMLNCLYESICLFAEIYKTKKREASLIEFSDFEHYALELLQNENTDVAKTLQDKYIEIFVDEYQDCNGVQELLFTSIAKCENGKSVNMFMVGDIKQSIYRFRQADPSIFNYKDETYSSDLFAPQAKVMLNKNFRSRSETLDYINNIFYRIMSKYAGEIVYDDREALYAGFDYPKCDEIISPKPEILVALTQNEEEEETPDDIDAPETATALEARMVANKIVEMMNLGYKVYDKDIGIYRPLRFKDIVVLLRASSTRAEVFDEEFKLRNIPYYTDGGKGYFETLEIKILISLLKVIDNPVQDLPLLSLLRSPIFNFNENELTIIRMASKGMFYTAIKKYSVKNDDLGLKCRLFLDRLSCWHNMALSGSIVRFLSYLLEDTNLFTIIIALPNGVQRSANINLILEYAKDFEAGNLKGLFNFINYIDKVKRHSDSGSAKMLAESCDVVRIMSIHKSKGLEFPVVFLSCTNTRFNKADITGKLLLHRELGIGCDFVDSKLRVKYPSVAKAAIANRIEKESISEEMRILYVALTRAREKLFITGTLNGLLKKTSTSGNEFINKKMLWDAYSTKLSPLPICLSANATSIFTWLTYCLDEDFATLSFVSYEGVQDYYINNKICKLSSISNDNQQEDIEAKMSILDYKYSGQTSTIPSKLSISELKRRLNYIDDSVSAKSFIPQLITMPNFMQEANRPTAAYIGTMTHLVLRFIDLNLPITQGKVDECINYLVTKNFLTKAESEFINRFNIINFLNSPLGQRLISSEKLYRELPFSILIDGERFDVIATNKKVNAKSSVMLQGIIDCLFIENNKFILIDYKTDTFFSDDAEIIEKYKLQLHYYALAAKELTGISEYECYIYLISNNRYLQL